MWLLFCSLGHSVAKCGNHFVVSLQILLYNARVSGFLNSADAKFNHIRECCAGFLCCRFVTGSWLLFQFGSVPEFLPVFKLSWCHFHRFLCCRWLGSWLLLCWPRLRLVLILGWAIPIRNARPLLGRTATNVAEAVTHSFLWLYSSDCYSLFRVLWFICIVDILWMQITGLYNHLIGEIVTSCTYSMGRYMNILDDFRVKKQNCDEEQSSCEAEESK